MQISRRRALGLGVGALVGLAAAPAIGAQTPVPPPNVLTDGIAGGGTVPTALGQAQFSLVAFVTDPGDGSEPVVSGSFTLQDMSNPGDPVMIQSTMLRSYVAYSTQSPNARQLIGFATNNGGGSLPFLLQVEDLGLAGSGVDTFNLVAGESATPFVTGADAKLCDCAGYSYGLKGLVSGGDIVRFALGNE